MRLSLSLIVLFCHDLLFDLQFPTRATCFLRIVMFSSLSLGGSLPQSDPHLYYAFDKSPFLYQGSVLYCFNEVLKNSFIMRYLMKFSHIEFSHIELEHFHT